MKATSARRKLIVVVLLALALMGAGLRLWADNPSTARDVGTMFLVLWVPLIGNVVGYLRQKLPKAAPPILEFEPGKPFTPHIVAEITPVQQMPAGAQPGLDGNVCTLLIGRAGFTVRTAGPLAECFATPGAHAVELEFLRPSVALPRLPVATSFHVAIGTTGVASGRVLQVLGQASGAGAEAGA